MKAQKPEFWGEEKYLLKRGTRDGYAVLRSITAPQWGEPLVKNQGKPRCALCGCVGAPLHRLSQDDWAVEVEGAVCEDCAGELIAACV